jgi:hypothetical protein
VLGVVHRELTTGAKRASRQQYVVDQKLRMIIYKGRRGSGNLMALRVVGAYLCTAE